MCFIDFKFPFNYFFYNLIENLKCDKISANKYFSSLQKFSNIFVTQSFNRMRVYFYFERFILNVCKSFFSGHHRRYPSWSTPILACVSLLFCSYDCFPTSIINIIMYC